MAPERDTNFAKLYESWVAHTARALRSHSELSKAITATVDALAESHELIAEVDAVLARNGCSLLPKNRPQRGSQCATRLGTLRRKLTS